MNKTLKGVDKAHDRSQVFRARAAFVFVSATPQQRLRQQRGSLKQRSRAFRPVNLMRADRDEVRVELMHVVKRFLSEPLHGIGMKVNALFPAYAAQLGNGLD